MSSINTFAFRSVVIMPAEMLVLPAIVFAQTPKPAPKPAEQKQPVKASAPRTAGEKKPEPANRATPSETPEDQLVKVTIETSRPEVTTDGGYGIFADMQNVSSVPLTLYPIETVLVIQPEVAASHDCIFSIDGFYPTEEDKIKKPPSGGPIIIQPKEHYVAFWDVSKLGGGHCPSQQGQSAERTLFDRAGSKVIEQLSFVPGDYAFVVVGKAHLSPGGNAESGYHTFTEHIKLHVGLTQLNAVVASALGGLIGYFVMALRGGEDGEFAKLKKEEVDKKRPRFSRWGVILRGLVSAALVSAVLTVLLSRISDTQFPIKVSVADFWGALTVGFVAYFSGNKLIDRIVGLASKSGGETPGSTPTPTTPTPTTPTPTTPAPTAPSTATIAKTQGQAIPSDVFTPEEGTSP